MKKSVKAFILGAVMLISCGCGAASPAQTSAPEQTAAPAAETGPAAEEPETNGFVSLTASEVAKNMGIGLNIGNTMEAYEATGCEKMTFEWIPVVGNNTPVDYETCWGAPVTTQAMVDGIKAAGFNTVRIPVFWGNMMENDGTWTINPDYIARVKEIVDYCMNDGMYAVVNIHHFDEFIIRRNDLEHCVTIFGTLWTQIAEYFGDYPETLVFEGFNEYLGGDRFNANGDLVPQSKSDAYLSTNTLNQTFVNSVRATGGNNAERVLIVSGYWTNIDNTTSTHRSHCWIRPLARRGSPYSSVRPPRATR